MALAPDANSQELDGRALYTIGRGMKHGRVPIDDGAVDKAIVLAHSKSVSVGHLILIIMKVFYKKKENRIYRKLFKVIIFSLYLQLLCPKHTISFGYFQL